MSVRLSDAERRELDDYCTRVGVASSSLARAALLDVLSQERPMPVSIARLTESARAMTPKTLQMLDELRRVRADAGRAWGLLNQMQRSLNSGVIVDAAEVVDVLEQVEQQQAVVYRCVRDIEESLQPLGGGQP